MVKFMMDLLSNSLNHCQ